MKMGKKEGKFIKKIRTAQPPPRRPPAPAELKGAEFDDESFVIKFEVLSHEEAGSSHAALRLTHKAKSMVLFTYIQTQDALDIYRMAKRYKKSGSMGLLNALITGLWLGLEAGKGFYKMRPIL